MPVQDELRDPWTYVVSGLAGGFAWAALGGLTAAAPPLGVAVGAAVFATKVLTGAFTRSGQGRAARRRERRLPVLTRSPEAGWLDRARTAQETFDEIASSAHEGPIAERVRQFGDQTQESLLALERLAGQASAIRSAMSRLDTKQLGWERDRLSHSEAGEDPRVLAERARALAAVESQLDAYGRLSSTLTMLLARLESGTLGIEGLVARLAEVVAMAETSVTAADGLTQVDELAHELEGLREGLAEAESVSARAMQGLGAPGSVADVPNVQRGQASE
jgi:hypothetical protein